MINWKIIYRVLGSLLFIEAGLLLLSLAVSFIYEESHLMAFGWSTAVACTLGGLLCYLGRKAENRMSRRDGYFIVAVGWVLFSLVGMLPYLFSGFIPRVEDAFFETMSGFTTTGATILDNIEEASHGLLFWRSMTQWIGGLGIVFFTIAVLPIFGLGEVKLFAAEATGPTYNKLHPRISTTAIRIWSVYSGLTLACAGCLVLCGISPFDSICHALTCSSTGGYSNYQDSVAHFHSPYAEYVLIFFMFISSLNFTLIYYSFFQKHIRSFFTNTELRWSSAIVGIVTLCCTVSLIYNNGYAIEEAFRKALFQVVSVISTSGYATDDYMTWHPALLPLICFIMFTGMCAGSTSGGFKILRVVMVAKIAINEFKHILHPNAVLPVRINDTVVNSSLKTSLLAFLFMFLTFTLLGAQAYLCMGLGYKEAFSVSLSSISNVGPALGNYGPAFSWSSLPVAGKWLASFQMLIGRLEIYSVLMLLTPHFWSRR